MSARGSDGSPAGFRVAVPATSANLGPGFDALGLALDWHDEVEVQLTSGDLDVSVSGEGADDVPRDSGHLVVRAMHATFDALGVARPGLALRCTNSIPHGRGLGSSAAAIVAGVLAARALTLGPAEHARADRPHDPELDMLTIAAEMEGHPDNVAPCLLGGATVAWASSGRFRAEKLAVHPEIRPVVYVPDAAVSTEAARGLLPDAVPLVDAARTAGRAAMLVEALGRRPDLLFDATEDWLHQEYRRPAMVRSIELVESLRADGRAAVLSGAGPSVLVLSAGGAEVSPVAGWDVRQIAVDRRGASVVALDPAGLDENAHEGYDTVAIGHED